MCRVFDDEAISIHPLKSGAMPQKMLRSAVRSSFPPNGRKLVCKLNKALYGVRLYAVRGGGRLALPTSVVDVTVIG